MKPIFAQLSQLSKVDNGKYVVTLRQLWRLAFAGKWREFLREIKNSNMPDSNKSELLNVLRNELA